MSQIAFMFAAVVILALCWTVFSMKRDGYIGEDAMGGKKKDVRKSGSIVFFKDSVKHMK